MLVLSRKNDQAVVVGGADRFENILKVTVVAINAGSVRLGFETNRDVPVHREEVWLRIVAGRAREPPACFAGSIASSCADGNAPVLSGMGKEGARNPARDGRQETRKSRRALEPAQQARTLKGRGKQGAK